MWQTHRLPIGRRRLPIGGSRRRRAVAAPPQPFLLSCLCGQCIGGRGHLAVARCRLTTRSDRPCRDLLFFDRTRQGCEHECAHSWMEAADT
jgi:hypothetical protein